MSGYKAGALFDLGRKFPFILVQTGGKSMCLMSTQTFNRWSASVEITRKGCVATWEDLQTMSGSLKDKLEYLCQFPMVPIDPGFKTDEVRQFIKGNKKVAAIKEVRSLMGWSLKKAKFEVELWGWHMGVHSAKPAPIPEDMT